MEYNDNFDFKVVDGLIVIRDDAGVLKDRRAELGLTQQQVADLAGIKLSQYQRLESGERSIFGASMRIGTSVCKVLYLDPLRFADYGTGVVRFPYSWSAGKGDSGGGYIDVRITSDEWHLLARNKGRLRLSECDDLKDLEKKVMMGVMASEVSTYLNDEDLLENLFDGEEISRDPKVIWDALTDRYEYGANFPYNLQK